MCIKLIARKQLHPNVATARSSIRCGLVSTGRRTRLDLHAYLPAKHQQDTCLNLIARALILCTAILHRLRVAIN